MKFDIADMRYAISISQYNSIRQAATALNIRQSTLSRRLHELEHHLGAVLFERTSGGTHPTVAGREFLKAACRIVSETDSAFNNLWTFCQGESGELSIGVYVALSAGNLRATLLEYSRRFPDIQIRMVDGARASLLSDLATGSLDIAILAENCLGWNDHTLSLWHERVVAAIPERHLLCAKELIHWADLKSEPLLINQREPGPEFHRLLMAKLGCQTLCHTMGHSVGTDRLLSLVGAGLGLTLVLEGATGAAYPGVEYREVHDTDGPTRVGFKACWRDANTNPTLKPFLALLRERYPDVTGAAEAD